MTASNTDVFGEAIVIVCILVFDSSFLSFWIFVFDACLRGFIVGFGCYRYGYLLFLFNFLWLSLVRIGDVTIL